MQRCNSDDENKAERIVCTPVSIENRHAIIALLRTRHETLLAPSWASDVRKESLGSGSERTSPQDTLVRVAWRSQTKEDRKVLDEDLCFVVLLEISEHPRCNCISIVLLEYKGRLNASAIRVPRKRAIVDWYSDTVLRRLPIYFVHPRGASGLQRNQYTSCNADAPKEPLRGRGFVN